MVAYRMGGSAQWSVEALTRVLAGSFSLEGGICVRVSAGVLRERFEQHWTVRCQVCGAGLPAVTRLETAQGVREMTLAQLSRWCVGVTDAMVEHVRSEVHLHQHAAYVNCLTAVMGVIGGGRAPRHLCRGNVSVHVGRLAGDVVPSRAWEGAPYPTRRDAQRHFGEARGLAVLLMRQVEEGRVGLVERCTWQGQSTFVAVKSGDIERVESGVAYVGVDGPRLRYNFDGAIFLRWDEMLPTTEVYFKRVVGRFPSKTLPQPAEMLDDYVRYEVGRPEGERPAWYVCLDGHRVHWTREEQRSGWPLAENIDRIRMQPPARTDKVWHLMLRIVPRRGSELGLRMKGEALGFGYMQIMVPEDGYRIVGWRSHVGIMPFALASQALGMSFQEEFGEPEVAADRVLAVCERQT